MGLHEACRALQKGDCTSAIVAGTSLIMGPTIYSMMTSEGILSPEGSCKTFDADANGFARAEGINAVYIKLLDDAIRDGNPIRAVIRNTGTNSDGKSHGLLTPSAAAQEALMRKVYGDAGLDPAETAFIEVRIRDYHMTCLSLRMLTLGPVPWNRNPNWRSHRNACRRQYVWR